MEDIYTFVREGVPEKVPLERWVWLAIYKDGSYLKQFDEETKQFHQFKEIDLEQLDTFVMQHVTEPSKRYEIHMRDGMVPIHFYRNQMWNAATADEVRVRIYCFGYQEYIQGDNRKTILKIFPDDIVSIENTDNRTG